MNERNNGNFWIGFLLGGFVGGLIIALMGTKEGKKLVEKFLTEGELWEEGLEEKLKGLKEKGEAFLENAQEVKEQVMEKVEKKKEVLGEVMVEKIDEALSNIENIQKKGVEITQDVHHNFLKKDGKPPTS